MEEQNVTRGRRFDIDAGHRDNLVAISLHPRHPTYFNVEVDMNVATADYYIGDYYNDEVRVLIPSDDAEEFCRTMIDTLNEWLIEEGYRPHKLKGLNDEGLQPG